MILHVEAWLCRPLRLTSHCNSRY